MIAIQVNDVAWAQCADGLWHRVRIVREDVRHDTKKPTPSSISTNSPFLGRHIVAHTQYHARWRPIGATKDLLGVFAQSKRKILPDNEETWQWLVDEAGVENVADNDRERLRHISVAPRGWQPGAEKIEKRREPF